MESGTPADGKQEDAAAPAVTKYEEPELARMIPISVPAQSAGGVNVEVKDPIDMVSTIPPAGCFNDTIQKSPWLEFDNSTPVFD